MSLESKRLTMTKKFKVFGKKKVIEEIEKPKFTYQEAVSHLSSISSEYLNKYGKTMHETDRQMLEESIKIVDGYYEYIKWQR